MTHIWTFSSTSVHTLVAPLSLLQYLALAGYPLVVSMLLTPATLSAPQLLVASQTRDRLDEGSHSPRSEPQDGAGGGADRADGADGAEVWSGGRLCRESKCVAQSSWSSVCRDTSRE